MNKITKKRKEKKKKKETLLGSAEKLSILLNRLVNFNNLGTCEHLHNHPCGNDRGDS